MVLTLPVQVQSPVAEDAWLRLGLTPLVEQAVRDLPGASALALGTVIGVAGSASAAPDVKAARARSGANVVVVARAQRNGAGWSMTATVHAGATMQEVSVDGEDALATTATLADRIRAVIAPSVAGEEATRHRPGGAGLVGVRAGGAAFRAGRALWR